MLITGLNDQGLKNILKWKYFSVKLTSHCVFTPQGEGLHWELT